MSSLHVWIATCRAHAVGPRRTIEYTEHDPQVRHSVKDPFFFFVIIDNEFFISQLGFDVRLTNSAVRHAGRIDLRIHGIWGTLYSHYYYIQWTSLDRVICRQLNFSDSILAVGWSVFGQGTGPQWYRARDIHCLGDESNLQSCTHSSQLQLTISGRAEDLSVICKPSATQARGELLPYFWADWITAYSITFKLVGIFFLAVGEVC